MTLIAITLSEKPPILTADILITSIDGKKAVKLPNRPSALSNEEVRNLVYKPDQLLQKLYVIHPNICMCAAGRVSDIKMILQDFRNFCKWKSNYGERWLDIEEIRSFFSSYDQEILI